MASRTKPKQEIVERLAKVSDMDWARMAAFIDGEGCVTIYKANSPKYNLRAKSPKFTLSVVVANCDPRMIQWIHKTFGGYVHIRKKQNSKWRVCYHWAGTAHLGMLVLEGCMPYFLCKRDQAEVALGIAYTMRESTSIVPPEVTARREELRLKLYDLKRQHFPEDVQFVN